MALAVEDRSAAGLADFARTWLAEQLPAGWISAVDRGDTDTVAALRAGLDYDDWCIRFGEAGLATPTWPAEYGAGLSLTPGEAKHVNDVLGRYQVPRPYNIIGIGMGGPTIMAWGTEEMKHRLLRPLACNQEIWCQLFSEPGAGSDVAGLATRAVRDGDEWVVNGQKVWTTLAHVARWGMLLCRTNPDVPKHGGLSYFVVDMHQPGVEVRPLVQITGDAEFNEVFFNDAKVRHDWMLGREGDGWKVAITTLMNERVSLSGAGSIGGDAVGGSPVERLLAKGAWHEGSGGPPAARAGVHREPPDPDQQRTSRREAQERWGGRPRGLDHEADAGRVQPTVAEPGTGVHRDCRHRVGGHIAVEVPSASGAARTSTRARSRPSASCVPRPTPSRGAPPTSCATSSASVCWGCRRSPMSPASSRGVRFRARAEAPPRATCRGDDGADLGA